MFQKENIIHTSFETLGWDVDKGPANTGALAGSPLGLKRSPSLLSSWLIAANTC
jgi:hypothetical protein